jgi:trehalose-6-phosphatase
VGDDETDEDVFHVAGDEVFSARVGHSLHSRARYYLKHQGEIASMLKIINHVLSAGAESGVVLQGGKG